MKSIKKCIAAAACALFLTGCVTSKDVKYIQDMPANTPEASRYNTGLIIEPDDLLSIVVTTKDPELGAMFNLQPGTLSSTISPQGVNSNETYKMADIGYRVDPEGNIVFPVLGTIHVAGLTRVELANLIKQRILKEGYLKELSVTVSFINSKISIIGDVHSPGNYVFKDDKYTILQALADAGDLNITAERVITVVREKNGKRELYEVDLKSRNLFDSPAYYLQQNDVIYVVPNDKKAGERDLNSNTWRQIGTWMSLVTFLASMTSIVVTLTKK